MATVYPDLNWQQVTSILQREKRLCCSVSLHSGEKGETLHLIAVDKRLDDVRKSEKIGCKCGLNSWNHKFESQNAVAG